MFPLCLLSWLIYFYSLVFLYFENDMSRGQFGGIYSAWCSLSLLDLWFGVWHELGKPLSCCFRYLFCSFLTSLSDIPIMSILYFFSYPTVLGFSVFSVFPHPISRAMWHVGILVPCPGIETACWGPALVGSRDSLGRTALAIKRIDKRRKIRGSI